MSFVLADQIESNKSASDPSSAYPKSTFHQNKNLNLDSQASVSHLQRTIGNHNEQAHMRSNSIVFEFAEIGILPRSNQHVDSYGSNALRDSNGVTQIENDAHTADDFFKPQLIPIYESRATEKSHIDLPSAGEPEEIVDQPSGDAGTQVQPTPAAADSCGQPRSMDKITSGPFLGGLTMDSYYPFLAGSGTYDHPDTAGTFDTGSRLGANVQLIGVIPSPCLPSHFHLEQTVTRKRFRIGGAVHPEEGKTFDDIAKSGGDYSRPPRRQEFLGGGTAPLGYIISMADPPSTGYNSTSDIEHDRDFVTSLVGPTGRQSVSWSLSTRISGGTVTSNVLT